ncbi:hypothetical protein HII17_08185 [Thalassotalea sp. M1531]|uniref:Uncharacterized protein n=1 Tax=Thalassotalea algicola TaxID=2716224 RepID=A0A7Y0LC20_9GAMM|nr:hypothetical protein [Thalassotalea algicola]NMP31537.1 hypothetical protein [Thalassotalea algicola]
MIYLYLGYLSAQLYSTFTVIQSTSMPFSALLFSIVVFLIWTFIPIVGYIVAYLLGARHRFTNVQLLLIGCGVGWLENGVFYFDLLNNDQLGIGMLLVAIVFFIIAFDTNRHKFGRMLFS